MKLFYNLCIFLFIGLCPVSAFAQNLSVDVSATVDKSVVKIGDRFLYKLRISRKPGVLMEIPDMDKILEQFVIVNQKIEQGKSKGKWLETLCFELALYETGKYEIPKVGILFKEKGQEKTVFSNSVSVEVGSILEPDQTHYRIRDIKQPLNVPFNYGLMILLLICLLFGAAIIAFIMKKLLKRNKGFVPFNNEISLSPDEKAFKLLDELIEEDLIKNGFVKEYYTRLSGILRGYLEDRYDYSAMDKTTQEISKALKSLKVKMGPYDLMRTALENSDLVKFAKYLPVSKESENDVHQARSFVEMTTEHPETDENIDKGS
ncbi:MAG: BatD family protein [Candidatus Theseobacter exili]|nr:BatD family protein [Candidatus Theseobacter exili]